MDAATLATAMGCSRAVADRYVVDMNAAMMQAGCTNVNRAAMWCAQVGHESVGLQYMEEIASGSAYEGRADLGNTQPGDGRRFKGRGPIQLTGRLGYTQFLRWCRDRKLNPPDFLADPAQVATSRWGFLAAAHYWTVRRPKLNEASDAGDLLAASRMINGYVAKPNGLADRQTRWDRCRPIGVALLPSGASTAPAVAPVAAAPPRRRSRREPLVLYFKSPEPAPGTAKKDWPTILIPYAFDPINGWGGRCILKVDWFGRGGWLKAAQWWIRDPAWSANSPKHYPFDHRVNAPVGLERFVGYGWETAPPLKADSIQITTSCPDGLVIQVVYER